MLRELPEGSRLSPTLFGIVSADLARVNHLKGNSQTQQFFTTHNTLSSSEAEFVAASQAGPEVLYPRALLTGFAYLQHGLTEIWKDNESCILMSENPTNRERSRHVDVRVHFLRDMVRDGSVKLIKCAGTQNVADALTKSLPRPAFHKHREFLKATAQSFSAFFASAYEPGVPAYVTKRGTLSFFKAPPKCIGG